MVSHSRALADAAAELGREVLQGQDVRVEVAAGLDDGALGTDAAAILDALGRADQGDGVVVLMDLGSAVLSAELALEMLEDEARQRVLLCAAPLVEGLVAACVAAAGGADRDAVAAEALAGLAGKQAHLGAPEAAPAPTAAADGRVQDVLTARLTVTTPHGLHARPAARLVQTARAAQVAVEVRNATTGSSWVPATSMSQVAVLGALSGHELQLRAGGAGAREALDALVALAGRSFDEDPGGVPRPAPPVAPPALSPRAPAPDGSAAVPASPGIAVGPAQRWRSSRPAGTYASSDDPATEWQRLESARASVREAVQRTRSRTAAVVGEQEAGVFDAHLLLLDDDEVLGGSRRRIDAGEPAAQAWLSSVAAVEEAFAQLADPYLRQRAEDVRAVGEQVRDALLARDGAGQERAGADGRGPGAGGAPVVLLAADLTPAEAAALDPARVAGLVLAEGSPTSHAAILVRGLGIPAVVGAGHAVLDTADGALVALDGATGELAVGADADVLARLRERADQLEGAARTAAGRSAEPARTSDGVLVHVAANVGSLEDARLAAQHGADGAGLVRTEFLFLGRDRAPDVEEQEAVYRSLAEALGGRRMTLRTLDVGGDKPLAYVAVPAEANPFLGLRGLRLSLAVPGLLADQLLAVVRLARETPVSVMFPMVSTVDELLAARCELDAAVARVGGGTPSGLRVGMMVEVPAAALKTPAFARHVDFFSVGTNDLTQYALAAERGNPGVAALSDAFDPGVLRLVAAVCAGAGSAEVAVCGELAADPAAAGLLLGLGVRELSVAPRAVPLVKQAVREVATPSAAQRAAQALSAPDAAGVRALLGAAGP